MISGRSFRETGTGSSTVSPDLGHTPFGHAGERALNTVYHFSHNQQSLRVVDCIEKQGRGLNLTWEVRDGILNHQTAGHPHTLEGQVVRISDKLAYIYHDMDDAIRGGILTEEDIPTDLRNILGNSCKERLNKLIHDVITNSMDRPRISMSPAVEKAMTDLRAFMFENVYLNPKAKGEENKAVHMVIQLYEYYMKHPELLPDQFLYALEHTDISREQVVCDHIAGMTDSYAVEKFKDYFVPESWKI